MKYNLKFSKTPIPKNQTFILMLSALIGIGAGLTALLLKISVYELQSWLTSTVWKSNTHILLFLYPLTGILLVSFTRQYIIKDYGRHNITSLLYAISKRNSFVRTHKMFSSVFGAILTAGFGGSIGLESPIISSGASIGSNLARWLKLEYRQVTLLLACGASAAIAGIFNTPIAGIVFSFEVLLLEFNRFSLIPLLISSVCGALTTWVFFPNHILLHFDILEQFSIQQLPWYLLLAIFGGLISHYFTHTFLFFERQFDRLKTHILRVFIGTLGLGILILLFPPLWGEGFLTIKALMNDNLINLANETIIGDELSGGGLAIFIFMLILLKVIATVFTIRAGGIGGIFAPSLFTGALLGFLFAYVINQSDLASLSQSNFTLVGMATVLGGVLQAPLTGIFLIAEITRGYELIVPLMLTTTISYITVKKFSPQSIITYQLAKRGELITHDKDKAVLSLLDLTKIIEKDFLTIQLDKTLGDLVELIAKSQRNIFPVIDHEQNLIGLIHLDNVRKTMFKQDAYSMPIYHIFKAPPEVINIEDTMATIIDKFNKSGAWNLPVINQNKYIGMISKSKLFSQYREILVKITSD